MTYRVYSNGMYLGDFTAKQIGDRLAAKTLNQEAVTESGGAWRKLTDFDDVLAALNAARRRRNHIWLAVAVSLVAACSYVTGNWPN